MTTMKKKANKISLRQKLSDNRRKISKVLIHILLLILVVIDIFPLYWMITFSLKNNNEIKGYKKESEKTRWEEIEDAIVGITGDRYEISWNSIKDAIMTCSNTAARKGAESQGKKEETITREELFRNTIDENWTGIKASIESIDGLFAENRTEDKEYMEGVYHQIEDIIIDVVGSNISIVTKDSANAAAAAEEESAEASPDGYAYDFAISMSKYQKQIRNAISTLFDLQDPTTPDPWEAIKESVGNMMGDLKGTLDQPETEYVPPNHVGLPSQFRWENYESALKVGRHYDPNSATKRNTMYYYFLNSLVVSASAIVITIMAAFMATYAMTRLVWKGRKAMNKFFMLGLTIPIHAAIVPVYMILSQLGWLNTYQALIIPYAAFSLAMAILISVGFMGDIPYDLDEAAFLDGCGIWGIFFRVIVPLMMPAIATVGIYTFLQCWNELLFATIFVSDGAYRTLPVGVQQLFGQYTTDWGPIGAALSIATIPTLIVYIALSKRIQAGFIAGAVKG